MAHIRQSRPGSGPCFQAKALKTFPVAPPPWRRHEGKGHLQEIDTPWTRTLLESAIGPNAVVREVFARQRAGQDHFGEGGEDVGGDDIVKAPLHHPLSTMAHIRQPRP